MKLRRTTLVFAVVLFAVLPRATTASAVADDDILIADFEGKTYGEWTVKGDAFGMGPAQGTLPGQMSVTGFAGNGLVNSYVGRDGSTGTLTSPAFAIERPWLNFLIGGGGYANETCINLLVDGRVVRTATGPNVVPGGSEELEQASWDVADLIGKQAVIEIVDARKGGWGHINVDQIVQSTRKAAPTLIELQKTLRADDTHLIVPVSNEGGKTKTVRLGLFAEDELVQSLNVALPRNGASYWLAAYPLTPFELAGREITVKPEGKSRLSDEFAQAFELIHIGSAAEVLRPDDYRQAYRNQFHVSSRRGWNNDPNGMVYHDGKYHLYYQHNPFGIFWGNMHWGHFVSEDLIHWQELPIALYQKSVGDMMFSGGGFVDTQNSAGLGKNTLFVAFTSTGRGECLAYSKDDGLTFTELAENPVVKHSGRDPKVIWYAPQRKWVMVVFDNSPCDETAVIQPAEESERHANNHFAFYESKDLRQWTQTGVFTDPDRTAVYECPELFELPVANRPGETRWITYGAQNRYFIGHFDGETFKKEAGPFGERHGNFYAAQTFSNVPDGRRIQVGWVQTAVFTDRYPAQIVNQSFTLPHEMTLRETDDGLRIFYTPVKEVEALRIDVLAEGTDLSISQASTLLQKCAGELTEVLIELEQNGTCELRINGIGAPFTGKQARIFTDRTFNEVYVDGGMAYTVHRRDQKDLDSTQTKLAVEKDTRIKSLKVYRLKSIW